jgi:UDP-N-acetylglucosamine 2-epimerase (non-hydrolysing)
MRKILACVGTRPNFIKIVRLKKLFEDIGFEYKILHTGQHFDYKMSSVFFEQLSLGDPDFYLGIGAGSNNKIVGEIIVAAENVFQEYQPDLVIAPGDVNSTFACAFAASSLRIPVAHIESGLRSFDMDMPEERNRILTDNISELLFVTEESGVENLRMEGISESKIKLVGNTIVDALLTMQPLIDKSDIISQLGIKKPFILVTFHRPINVDNKDNLQRIVDTLLLLSVDNAIVFPVHPRTKKHLESISLLNKLSDANVFLIDPLGYIEFIKLMQESICVVSDSGGVQIESSYFNIPCFTVRETTELKITLEKGTNQLVSLNPIEIFNCINNLKILKAKEKSDNKFWDGKASERIVAEIRSFLK